jgi:hypothetical protein
MFLICILPIQNIIPVVDGLLPEPYNTHLLKLLYRMAEWHALAKLRMHTDSTLQGLDNATTAIGHELRFFREWSRSSFTVKELPSEATARKRRKRRAQTPQLEVTSTPTATGPTSNSSPAVAIPAAAASTSTATTTTSASIHIPRASAGTATAEHNRFNVPVKVKILNLFTYKLHALGDYVQTIRLFGTTDSYSTQTV